MVKFEFNRVLDTFEIPTSGDTRHPGGYLRSELAAHVSLDMLLR